jgi:hypothetical protein
MRGAGWRCFRWRQHRADDCRTAPAAILPTVDNRLQLGDFLRRRREELSPADVGLPAGGGRRTPGLRRDEVAALAHMSAVYYERLEQGRGPVPSAGPWNRPTAGTILVIGNTGDPVTPYQSKETDQGAGRPS